MNFYPMHIGDYTSATSHLSWYEDCAYRRLLDQYYMREQALPANITLVCRLVCAQTKKEKTAISAVLEEFFTLTDAGWTHKRCEAEIVKATERRERATASANARWSDRKEASAPIRKGGTAVATRQAGTLPAHQQCSANTMPPNVERNAEVMPAHSERTADALPPHCEGNAPNTNTNTNTNPTPLPCGGSDSPVSQPSAHDPPPGVRGRADSAVNASHGAPGTPIPTLPTQVGEWINFFSRHGFARERLQDPKLRPLIGEWIAAQADQPLLHEAMQQAEQRLGYKPDSPLYYRQFVGELLRRESRPGRPVVAPRPPRSATAARYAELNPNAFAPYIASLVPPPDLPPDALLAGEGS